MKIYIFVYNVVALKANLTHLNLEQSSKKILIGSQYAIEKLSDLNRSFFDDIYTVQRNFHQVSYEQVEAILKKYLEEYTSENIRLLSNEDSTKLVCAKLRKKYYIKGYSEEELSPYVNKEVSKYKLSGEVRVPKFLIFDKAQYLINAQSYVDKIIHKVGFPIFIKPTDLVSSMNTYHVSNKANLLEVLDKISALPWQFEIDEFIEGDLYHCDIIVKKNELLFFSVGKYAAPLAQFSKGFPMGSIPIVDEKLIHRLKNYCTIVLKQLGMMSSAFHIEVFIDVDADEFIFLEAAARTPGALVPEMYEIIYDSNLELMHFQVQTGQKTKVQDGQKSYAGWITYPKVQGELVDIIHPILKVEHQFMANVCVGEHLSQAQTLLDSGCSIVFWSTEYKDIVKAFDYLKNFKPLLVANSHHG